VKILFFQYLNVFFKDVDIIFFKTILMKLHSKHGFFVILHLAFEYLDNRNTSTI
jgi:hypothetical protein